MSIADSSDIFRLVTGKRKVRINNNKRIFGLPSRLPEAAYEFNLERKLGKIFNNWEFQEYLKEVIVILEAVQEELANKRLEKLICFGIGSFTLFTTSLHQLAFFLRIQEHFNIAKVDYYDPVLNGLEKRLLKGYGWHLMGDNCEGKYPITESALIYLPHCPKQLTNNLLWENWQAEKLNRIILICNSFNALVSNTPARFLNTDAEYILKICDYMKEISLDGKYFLADVFNDTSIHILPNDKCTKIEKEFWMRKKEAPQYSSSELITRESGKTTVMTQDDENECS